MYCTVNQNKTKETLRVWSISCKVCDDCIADVLRAVLCSCFLVRPPSIRALVLPRWALSKSTSLTVHTFTNAKRHPSSSTYSWNLTLQSINFIFRDELQWAAEYSEARDSFGRPIIHKLMTKSILTLPTPHLVCPRPLLIFGHTVFMDGLCESWPGWRVFVLGAAGEQLVITLGAHINPWLKMVFEDLSTKERAKRHCFFFPYVQCEPTMKSVLTKRPTYQAVLLVVTAHAHNSKRPYFRFK